MNLRSKRAVSPVIATILLIAIVVVAVGITWGVIRSYNTNSGNLVLVSESYYDANNNGLVDKIKLTLKNTGTTDQNITSVLVNANNTDYTSWYITSSASFAPNSEGILIITTLNSAEELATQYDVLLTLSTNKNTISQLKLTIPKIYSLDVIGEAGTVSVGGTEVTVQLNNEYNDPVVVAVPVAPSDNAVRGGTDAAQWPLITSVTSNSFKIKQITTSTNGTAETLVNYIVMETGVHYVHNIKIQVGKATINGNYQNVSFPETFISVPSVIAATQTNNHGGLPRTRGNLITTSNVRLQLEDGDSSSGSNSETVGYIAIEQGSDQQSGLQAYTTGDSYTHTWKSVVYNFAYANKPIVIAHLTNEDGGDPSYAAISEVTTIDFKASVEETTAADGPHTTETICWVALPSGTIYGSGTS